MSFEVSVQSSFSAAHRLKGYSGRCENMHGHNWKVGISVSSARLDKQGMVVDFTVLKKSLNGVLANLDHKVLSDIPYFKKFNPTSENIARYIFDRLCRRYKYLKVTVWETDTSCATYSEDK